MTPMDFFFFGCTDLESKKLDENYPVYPDPRSRWRPKWRLEMDAEMESRQKEKSLLPQKLRCFKGTRRVGNTERCGKRKAKAGRTS